MPLKKIVFKPGINRENTRYTTEGGWYEADKVRFRQGTPEKIGGWARISSTFFLGICRSLWNWITLGGLNLISLGTNLKFYLELGGTYFDITPLRYSTLTDVVNNPFTTIASSKTITVTDASSNVQTGDVVNISGVISPVDGIPASEFNGQHTVTRVSGTQYTFTTSTAATAGISGAGGSVTFKYLYYTRALTNAYTTVNLSTTVTVHDVANGCITNDFVTLSPSVTFNGVTINGGYQVTVIDSDNYTIQASTPANASGSSTGTTYAQYQINTGPEIQVPRVGWGAGPWGAGGWGIGQSSNSELRIWSQSNFGESLVFSPRYGGMYYWDATKGITTRGVDLATLPGASDVPTVVQYIAVSDVSRFIFAFGCNDYGSSTLDPMLIRWSDQESLTMWTPDATNQAGSLRLSHGSEIASAWQVRQEIVVFTDSTCYSLQYLGAPAVWGSQLLGDNISIIGPNAVSLASGVLYWMGRDKFYKYDGSVSTLSCDLRQYIFGDINLSQSYQVFSSTNEGFNEVWWFYCSANSNTVDRYVIYNYLENVWYYGTMARSAWLDSGLRNYPIAATYINNLVYHEDGVDDGSTLVPTAIDSYILSSEFDIDDGHNFGFIYRILPDLTFRGSSADTPQVTMTLIPLQNSGSGYTNPASVGGIDYGTINRITQVPVEEFTGQIFIRVRGRQLVFKIEGNQLGLAWQLGAPRIDIRADGRRGNS
jgi:hypothetical protein